MPSLLEQPDTQAHGVCADSRWTPSKATSPRQQRLLPRRFAMTFSFLVVKARRRPIRRPRAGRPPGPTSHGNASPLARGGTSSSPLARSCHERGGVTYRAMTQPAPPRLLERTRSALRMRHYSLRTEEAYVALDPPLHPLPRQRHPASMGRGGQRLPHLPRAARPSPPPPRTRRSRALLFLYRDVLERPLPWLDELVRAKRPRRLPVVLTPEEVRRILAACDGTPLALARLLYGSGLRLLEACGCGSRTSTSTRGQILVRDGKGRKDRRTMLPTSLADPLRATSTQCAAQSTSATSPRAPAGSRCPTPSREVPGRPAELAVAVGLSRTRTYRDPRTGEPAATTSTRSTVQRGVERRPRAPASPSPSAATPSATPSPPTSSRTATTSAPSRSSSATRTSRPP